MKYSFFLLFFCVCASAQVRVALGQTDSAIVITKVNVDSIYNAAYLIGRQSVDTNMYISIGMQRYRSMIPDYVYYIDTLQYWFLAAVNRMAMSDSSQRTILDSIKVPKP